MIKVQFAHLEDPVDVNDDEKLVDACRALAVEDIKRVPLEESRQCLEDVITTLHAWHLKNGAQIHLAHIVRAPGIAMGSVIDSHDFIGRTLLNKGSITNELTQWPEFETGDKEPGENDHLEGEDAA